MSHRLLWISAALAALCGTATAQTVPNQRPAPAPYTWKSVQMVGGGFVDGIVFHPTAKGVRYARTDIGGAYRWNDVTHRWEPMLDWVPYENLNWMGVESVAVDASDPNRVYLACGTYTNPSTPDGAILRSSDRGKTFQHTNVPFKFGGNENGRGHGERLAVDPNSGNILYLGTRWAGLWKSVDRAVTWTKVESFPDVTEEPPAAGSQQGEGSGIVFVVFDPRSGVKGKPTSTIYVGVALMGRDNLFRSKDGGKAGSRCPTHRFNTGPRAPRWLPTAPSTSLMSPAPTRTGHRRRHLEARHRQRRVDGYHARPARRRQQESVRLRRCFGGRASSPDADCQHVLPPQRR